jgi:hypothetical protein
VYPVQASDKNEVIDDAAIVIDIGDALKSDQVSIALQHKLPNSVHKAFAGDTRLRVREVYDVHLLPAIVVYVGDLEYAVTEIFEAESVCSRATGKFGVSRSTYQ